MEGVATADVRSSGRERCPTCAAPRRGDTVCHRCKSDLSLLAQIESQADALRAEARRCYARGWYRQAAALAGKAVSLEDSMEDRHLLACAYLLSGDFGAAWKAYLRCGPRDAGCIRGRSADFIGPARQQEEGRAADPNGNGEDEDSIGQGRSAPGS